jgi:multiple sugar transport system substrate-binding protein
VLEAWAHSGREAERRVMEGQVARFNRSHDSIRVDLTLIPEGSYNAQVQAAALAGDLPDLLEFDGPYVYGYVWQNHLVPIGDDLSSNTRERILDSVLRQGTYRGELYSVGQFDSGLALFARKSLLEAVEARLPAGPEDAWSIEEFERILSDLASLDPDGQVLDLKLNYGGEWYTFGFAPILWSAGAGLIDRRTYRSADGVLDGPAAVDAMRRVQRWILDDGFVDPNVDDHAFLGGRVALSWVGHWEYGRYRQAHGDDLALVPFPDFGQGVKTGQGSWNWGVTRGCTDRKAAVAFLEFLLEDEQILEMTGANGAIPATVTAISKSEAHREGGPLHLYARQLREGYSVPRPRTPAYPVLTSIFQQTFRDIRVGVDVKTALGSAVREIALDIEYNEGYPQVPAEKASREGDSDS